MITSRNRPIEVGQGHDLQCASRRHARNKTAVEKIDDISACRRQQNGGSYAPLTACRRHRDTWLIDHCRNRQIDWLAWAIEAADAAIRSIMLLGLLGLCRLLLFALPKKGGTCNNDPAIDFGRRLLAGAPMGFVFAVVLCTTAEAMPAKWNYLEPIGINEQMAMSIQNRPAIEYDTGQLNMPRYMYDRPENLFFEPMDGTAEENGEEEPATQDEVQAPEWTFAAAVYPFQCKTIYAAIRCRTDIGVSGFCRAVMRDIFIDDEDDYILIPVEPQPSCDQAVLLMTHICCLGTGLVPVMIDVTDFGRTCFMAYLTEYYVSIEDLRDIMGPEWIPCAYILVGHDVTSMHSERRYPFQQGTLVRIRRDTRPSTLTTSMSNLACRRFGPGMLMLLDLPVPRRPLEWGSVHEERYSDRTFPNFARRAGEDLKNMLADLIDRPARAFTLQTSARIIWGFALRGRPVEVSIGIHPVACDWRTGFFLDARELGREVRYLLIPPVPITLDALLEQADIQRPRGWEIKVDGTATFIRRTEQMIIGQGALVVLQIEPFRRRDDPVDEQEEMTAASRGDREPDGPLARSRSPRRGGTQGPPTHADSGQPSEVRGAHVDHSWAAELHALQTVLDDACLTDIGKRKLQCSFHVCQAGSPLRKSPGGDVILPVQEDTCSSADHEGVLKTTVALKLADILPQPSIDLDVQTLRIMSESNHAGLLQLLQPWSQPTMGTDLDGVRIHDNTVAAIELCQHWTTDLVLETIDIYTDGSAKDGNASYAVAMFGNGTRAGARCFAFMGCFGGVVCSQEHELNYLGASQMVAIEAELSAIAWAALWVIAHKDMLQNAVLRFRFDAMAVGWGAAGKWAMPDSMLALKTRQLLILGRKRVQWSHVKGHSGHPLNELVDSVATAFREGASGNIPRPRPCWTSAPGHLELQWANLTIDEVPGGCRPRMVDGLVNWSLPNTRLTALRPEDVIPIGKDKLVQALTVSLKAVTVNVQSASGKYHCLEQQLIQKQVNVAFLQETKSKEGTTRSKHYLRYASASEGHWGTEVWIARRMDIAKSGAKSIRVDEANVADHFY